MAIAVPRRAGQSVMYVIHEAFPAYANASLCSLIDKALMKEENNERSKWGDRGRVQFESDDILAPSLYRRINRSNSPRSVRYA